MKITPHISDDGERFELAKAILIYKSNRISDADRQNHNYDPLPSELRGAASLLCSLHEVRHDLKSGKAVIAEGELLKRSVFETMLRDMASEDVRERFILPENLLFADLAQLVWWSPAKRRKIYFSTADQAFNKDVDKREVAQPALLFRATPTSLNVFALAESKRPDLKTSVLVAPFCNLYEGGAMCRGDVAYPGTVSPTQIPAWEAAFFDSRFTHSNLGGKTQITTHEGGHNGLWREMVKAKSFDAKYLTPTESTVADVLAGMFK